MKALKRMVMKLFCIARVIKMEKEKVIKALETCIGCRPCKDCPFDRTVAGITNFPNCMVELQKEALSVIKELEGEK